MNPLFTFPVDLRDYAPARERFNQEIPATTVHNRTYFFPNDEVVEVEAGGWHLRPRMIKHTFWNGSDKSLRFIDMYFNQPFEEYLEKIFHQLTPENGYPNDSEKKRNELKLLSESDQVIFL